MSIRWILSTCLAGGAICAPSLAQCLIGKFGDPNASVSEYYSYRISLDGHRSLVSGSPYGIHAYERVGPKWIPTGTLPAPGFEPAVHGNTAMIGAWDYGGEFGYGLVTVLEHDGNQWKSVAELEPLDKYDGNWFGWSIALSEGVSVIGAVRYDTGKAYVFERNASGAWKQTAKLSPDLAGSGEKFGTSVATDGNTVVIGAPFDWSTGITAGAAYVFNREGGTWVKACKLLPPEPVSFGVFGQSVAVAGDCILVGSSGADVMCCAEGAVYEYTRVGREWIHSATLTARSPQNSELFGTSVALDTDVLVVGADGGNSKGPASGAAYVFTRDSKGAWTQTAHLVPDDGKPWDNFGTDVAVSGNIAVIGMWQQKPDPPWEPGFARFYAVGPDMNGNGLMDPCECPGDLDKNWIVDQADLAWLLAFWGKCQGDPGFKPEFDLDASGCIDQGDLGVVLANYGKICP